MRGLLCLYRGSADELEGTPVLIFLSGDSRDKVFPPGRTVRLGTLDLLLLFLVPLSPVALLQFFYAVRLVDVVGYAVLVLVLVDDLDDIWVQILYDLPADLVALHRPLLE
jgi:hypothetical protein